MLADQYCPSNNICGFYPCPHSSCKDIDWCAQIIDEDRNPELCREAYYCIIDPCRKFDLDPLMWAEIESRIDRWYTIQGKWGRLEAEIRAFYQRLEEEERRVMLSAEDKAVSDFTARITELRIT
jgi:hypothetical protein